MFFFSILFIVACAYSEIYNEENATKLFKSYKMKYNKHYKNEAENQRGLRNFINNLNKVSSLNKRSADNATLFVVNMYADMDPMEVQERYAISLRPYSNLKDPHDANMLRHGSGKFVEDTLYDLTQTDQLYKEFMTKYNKTIAKKSRDRASHYYRFLKTLVEINRNNFEGHEHKVIDANADVIKAPHNYV